MAEPGTGELDLIRLLQGMKPELDPREWVFCTVSELGAEPGGVLGDALGMFREAEGVTLILERAKAEVRGLSYSGVFSKVTLTVHSSLDAVGFLAVVSRKLAAAGIAINAVSAFYHDHLFVPVYQRQRAMAELDTISRKA